MDMRLEVVVLPVSHIDRAKEFDVRLGWRLDADFVAGDDSWVVQLTPPGSPCSVIFGTGVTTAAPGSAVGLYLVVDDIEAARAELVEHGAQVSKFSTTQEACSTTRGRRHACQAPTRSAAVMHHSRRSVIPMATAGCFRKSPPAFAAAARTHALRRDRRTLFRDSGPAQTLCQLGRNRESRRDRGGARVGWQQMNFIDALAKEYCCRLSLPEITAESV